MVFDPVALDNLAQIDEEGSLVEELIRLYHTDSSALVAGLRAAWTAGDVERLGTTAHTLKSASGLVGAVEVMTRARDIEIVAREQRTLGEVAAITAVESAYTAACGALTAYLDAKRGATVPAARQDPAPGTAC
jgi:two-component system, sensor histidine kinase and response regulator